MTINSSHVLQQNVSFLNSEMVFSLLLIKATEFVWREIKVMTIMVGINEKRIMVLI